MKNMFMVGLGLGFVLGNYVLKHCPAVRNVYDTAENAVMDTVQECKTKMHQKKQADAAPQM